MGTFWFTALALMLATYVVLDGFDFGAGILHLFVAKTDAERRQVFAAIGPVWDGNEVWLLASGCVLVLAFPRVYASGFSGFYLPLTIVLWLLVLRGLSIEFRNHEENSLWRAFFDATFALASALLAIVLGAALGNVVRGVPLDTGGYFRAPLWTDWREGPTPGVLDWYTVLVGVFTLVTLAGHGALYLRWKTSGALQARVAGLVPKLWASSAALLLFLTWPPRGCGPTSTRPLSGARWPGARPSPPSPHWRRSSCSPAAAANWAPFSLRRSSSPRSWRRPRPSSTRCCCARPSTQRCR